MNRANASPICSSSNTVWPRVMALTDDHQERLEIGLIGREGIEQEGGPADPVRPGCHSCFNSLIVQAAGEAYRIAAPALHDIMQQAPALRRRLYQTFEIFFAQVSQTAVCNAQHVLHRRLARWLLSARDRASKDDLPLTQEFLAIMLGVQRPRVTLAVDLLSKAGLVKNSRGHIIIHDRLGSKQLPAPATPACGNLPPPSWAEPKFLANSKRPVPWTCRHPTESRRQTAPAERPKRCCHRLKSHSGTVRGGLVTLIGYSIRFFVGYSQSRVARGRQIHLTEIARLNSLLTP